MRESLMQNCNAWNGGELYGTKDSNLLHLLNKYVTKYPEDADKIVLCIKATRNIDNSSLQMNGSPDGVRRSIENCLKILDGKLKLDLFELAKVDRKVRKRLSLSQSTSCSGILVDSHSVTFLPTPFAERQGSARSRLLKSSSLSSRPIFLRRARHSNSGILPSQPRHANWWMGQGGKHLFPERYRHWPCFKGDALRHNIKLVEHIEKIARSKNATAVQVGLGWIVAMSGRDGLPTIIPIPGSITEEKVKENANPAKLTDEDLKSINDFLKSFEPIGMRYPEEFMHYTYG